MEGRLGAESFEHEAPGAPRAPPQRSQHASHAEALHYDETIELEIIGVTNAVP